MSFLRNKFLVIFSSLCIASSALYTILVHNFIFEEDILLSKEPSFNGLPCSLSLFNFEKINRWHDMPEALNYDVFTLSAQTKLSLVSNESQNLPIPDLSFPVRLNGWSGSDNTMIFVFSVLNSNKTFIGGVGDSFDDPSFSIVSFELKANQEGSHSYSMPTVTILDKKGGRLLNLSPSSSKES